MQTNRRTEKEKRQVAAATLEQVPATLDLAARMRLALNGVLGLLDPKADYEPIFATHLLAQPPYMVHWSGMYSGMLPKLIEAIPLLRSATGSEYGREIEEGMLAAVFKNISHDGLIYDEERPDRPWNSGIGYGVKSWREDFACLAVNGRLVRGFYHYKQATGDDSWTERMGRTAGKLVELAIVKDDYAYYPNVGLGTDFSYPKHSGWVHTNEPASGPMGGEEGAEGATNFFMSQPIRGLMRYYRVSGDERALDISRRLKVFVLQPHFWGGNEDLNKSIGGHRGHFSGHFHGTLATLRALLEYATIVDDWTLKEFVHDGYEWAKHHGAPRLGLFPHWGDMTEACTVADMVALGIQLSDQGLGDYWDDVDHYVRNALVESQAHNLAELEATAGRGSVRPPNSPWGAPWDRRYEYGQQTAALPGQELTENVVQRAHGAFCILLGPFFHVPLQTACCTANGSQALYYAWESILRRRPGDLIQVNLLLNRRSPDLDIESWLPHEGRVLLRVKSAVTVAIRVPSWVNRSTLHWRLDGEQVSPSWTANYATFTELRPDQVVTMTFTLQTETVMIANPQLNGANGRRETPGYTVQFRGGTAVHIDRPGESPGGQDLPYYQSFLRSGELPTTTPLRDQDPYVAQQMIDW